MMGGISGPANWQTHWIERKGQRSGTLALTFVIHLDFVVAIVCKIWHSSSPDFLKSKPRGERRLAIWAKDGRGISMTTFSSISSSQRRAKQGV
ncbi:hypothetical protein ARMSODRAFT_966666 [Armillaria solidipes]|uniref:Uncharacterized protein n=1 Tax=Armillaria solidipes TaxID=1076256 RepID=A0A2H3AQB4_9AGAR|nr:hypothetical protein ARMSODRAFT_966666 [Armillaria solidipes]